MSYDPYAYCPCGSGKKVKWCCAPYLTTVERAFRLLEEGQQESSHKLFQDLLQRYGTQATPWLYYANFLMQSQRWEEAEAALEQALQRDPQLGMAYYYRGILRQQEGEHLGALLLFHKAVDRLSPEARDQLLQVFVRIAEVAMFHRLYLTAAYATERALHLRPDLPELHQWQEKLLGPSTGLPQAVRHNYRLRRTRRPIAEQHITGRLGDARRAYEELVQQTPADPAAWFNLGLICAWQGENVRAVEALYRSLDAETDDRLAEETGTLVEVLLTARGMEALANYLEHLHRLQVRDPQRLWQLLEQWHRQGKITQIEYQEETGLLRGYFVEEVPVLAMSEHTPLYRITARFYLVPGELHLLSPWQERVEQLAQELYQQAQLALAPPQHQAHTLDPRNLALCFLTLVRPEHKNNADLPERELQYVTDYFEAVWLHQPLKSLEGNSPLDAMGSSRLRKRVFGAVRFLEDCYRATLGPHEEPAGQSPALPRYDFGRLRHKLGLEYTSVPPSEPEVSASPTPADSTASRPAIPQDLNALNVAELAALDRQALSVEQIEQAMRAALRLDARELAVAFARAGVDKPFDPARPDRYPLFATAITGALVQGNYPEALQLIQRGEQYDNEHNRGARAIDYALKRANVYVRMKDVEQAVQTFDQLIARYPQEGRLYTTAAEEMLRLKATDKARYFADRGLRLAHQSQNRDLEAHCRELLAAADKTR
ncbi:MAG: tetratricopeptide repeat protein [Gemmataceae bacterium]|nr:tetratricopeptide repeat protein [Gemmataceae bacterium]MCS7270429.1 tetratricopeptide repeat protein [Gemmataceae bacterium]MDW8241995.1 tetratricopeptide repeat protein [Thermogemmata sp.]